MFDPKHHQAIAEALHGALCRHSAGGTPNAGHAVSALVTMLQDDNPAGFDAYAFTAAVQCEEP